MLTIQYVPYEQISNLSSVERVKRILLLLQLEKVLIIDGRLKSTDEALLIRETMNSINEEFNGIEIGIFYNQDKKTLFEKMKHDLGCFLIGKKPGMTFIGPAKILSELIQNPDSIEIHFQREYLLKHSKKKNN